MGKRRLTRRQLQHVQTLQDERLARARTRRQRAEPDLPGGMLGPEREGLVIARFGAAVALEDEHATLYRCAVRQNLGDIVCGDRVVWQSTGEGEGIVIARMPRRSLLARPDYSGHMKPLAANLDQIVILAAPQPELSEDLIDRYLVAAELLCIPPLILVNKIDLLDPQGRAALEARLADYRRVGYRSLFASVREAHGLDALLAELRGRTSVLVGQSGVGKSSLIKRLLPHQEVRIGELSAATGLGTHTTTRTTLYRMPRGGALIDSPGVRAFGLWDVDPGRVAAGFVEFRPYLGACRFSDCSHRVEPGCALQAAAADGKLHPRRLANYHRIVEALEARSKE
jgi:ribosome biogenesis GTPase / thiamine phosphate phosphatase